MRKYDDELFAFVTLLCGAALIWYVWCVVFEVPL